MSESKNPRLKGTQKRIIMKTNSPLPNFTNKIKILTTPKWTPLRSFLTQANSKAQTSHIYGFTFLIAYDTCYSIL